MSILECSIHIFQASCETFSYTRLPRSPFQGTRSRPGMSLSNFTQWTMRAPGFAGVLKAAGFTGPQESSAIFSPPSRSALAVRTHYDTANSGEIQSCEILGCACGKPQSKNAARDRLQ